MRKPFPLFVIILTFLVLPFISKGQARAEDVIYLKSGAILYGTITENIPNEHVTIQTDDGNRLTNNWDQVYKITKTYLGMYKKTDTTFYAKGTKMSGFMNITEFNFGTAFYQDEVTNSGNTGAVPFGFRTVFGYLLNPQFSIGVGIEYDKVDSFSFLPIFIDLRVYPEGSDRLAFALDLGGAPEITPNRGGDLGGFMCTLSINEKIRISKKTSFIIGGEYTHQSFINMSVASAPFYMYASFSYFKLNLGLAFD